MTKEAEKKKEMISSSNPREETMIETKKRTFFLFELSLFRGLEVSILRFNRKIVRNNSNIKRNQAKISRKDLLFQSVQPLFQRNGRR
jgi:hypothetical protein